MGKGQHVILYTSSKCIRCRLVRQMLNEHNVEYEEIADNEALMIEKGLNEFPALEVDGVAFDDYSSVLSWLEQNNYYSLWGDDKNESNET